MRGTRPTFFRSVVVEESVPSYIPNFSVIRIPLMHCNPKWLRERKQDQHARQRRSSFGIAGHVRPLEKIMVAGTPFALVRHHSRIFSWLIWIATKFRQVLNPERFKREQQAHRRHARRIVNKMLKSVLWTNPTNNNKKKNVYNPIKRMTAVAFNAARQAPRFCRFDSDSYDLVVDSGASCCMTPYKKDFLPGTYEETTEPVHGLGAGTAIGKGTVRFHIDDDNGKRHAFDVEETMHVPELPERLFCPQHWSQVMFKTRPDLADSGVDNKHNGQIMYWTESDGTDYTRFIPYTGSNIGVIGCQHGFDNFRCYAANTAFNAFNANYITDDEYDSDDETVPTSEPATKLIPASEGAAASASEGGPSSGTKLRDTPISTDFSHVPTPKPDVVPTDEQSKDKPLMQSDQRLFMEYHERLGHLSWEILRVLAATGLIPKKLAKCPAPKCPGCLYGKATRKPWRTKKQPRKIKPATTPGQVVSVDQMESPIPGLVAQKKGSLTVKQFSKATVFVDHFSDLTYVHLQESLTGEETVEAKLAFERYARAHGVEVKHYHADNGRFADKAFMSAVEQANQTISFCGVGAHHQNGKAERRIRDLTDAARTMLLHAAHRWPKAVNAHLWPYALKHAMNIRNSLPRVFGKGSPLSTFSRTTVEPNLKNFHPFGCPVYILEEALQSAGSMFPKWNDRSKVGIFLQHSPHHATDVPLLLNTQTGLVTPQFHCVYDDNFDTVAKDAKFESLWQAKARFQAEADTSTTAADQLSTSRDQSAPQALRSYSHTDIPRHLLAPWDGSSPSPAPDYEGATTGEPDSRSDTEGDTPGTVPDTTEISTPPTGGLTTPPPADTGTTTPTTDAATTDTRSTTTTRSGRRVRAPVRMSLMARTVKGLDPRAAKTYAANLIATLTDPDDGALLDTHPLAMLVTWTRSLIAKRSDPDTMTLTEAMKQLDREQFIEAMIKEVTAHTEKGHWEVVRKATVPWGNKPILAVWSMKRKRDPAGDIIKWKARLCAHGGMQIHGVNYWDTYSPVVSWSTVRLVLILALVLGWHTRSLDFVLAYPQADVKTDIFMRPPQGCDFPGFDTNRHLLKLKKNLYGLKDAGLTWHEHIKKGLVDRGFKPSSVDPCLFTKGKVILILYVDDCVLVSPHEKDIDAVVTSLKEDFNLTDEEGPVRDYLGIRIERIPGTNKVALTQPRMIHRCLQLIGLDADEKVKTHDTPANENTRVLTKDDPEPRKHTWNYRSVIGALTYLQAMSRPDLSYSVHQCARYSNDPRKKHEDAVKRICRYLKRTQDKGMILSPDLKKGFECQVDADFAGNWNKKFSDDPVTALSRTGYVITYAGCPVIWASKIQTLVALSTTESELIALSSAVREVIAMMNLLKELKGRGIPVPFTKPNINCTVFEDNVGAIEVATTPKYRPRTKHMAVRFHHFRDHVARGDINIKHVRTQDQLGDLFTKPLPLVQFRKLRLLIMGW